MINEENIRGSGEVLLGNHFILYGTSCCCMGLIGEFKGVAGIKQPGLQLYEQTL